MSRFSEECQDFLFEIIEGGVTFHLRGCGANGHITRDEWHDR